VGQLTASDESLDADVILAAQATILNEDTDDDFVDRYHQPSPPLSLRGRQSLAGDSPLEALRSSSLV
jgi:hypothetical protein